MQPYFLPYLGYFQLMALCDVFVIYDNIQFTKKGWIHRNRMLLNGKDTLFSISLKSDSDYLDIDKRYISDGYVKDRSKILGQIRSGYGKAPFFAEVYPLMELIFNYEETNLFRYVYHSIVCIKEYLDIPTPLVISSSIDADHSLKGKDRVMDIIMKCDGDTYINPIGGVGLYDKAEFGDKGIGLHFHKMRPVTYPQFAHDFVPYLSVMDVLFFNHRDQVKEFLKECDLV